MATPVCTIDAAGLHMPAFTDCLSYFQDTVFRGVYGSDLYLGPDSQDGQFTALLALALSDTNAMGEAAYNSFSPSTAQGVGLSRVVKINGMARGVPTYSTVDFLVVGQAGAVMLNGVVSDDTNKWLLPASVTIPLSGQITVTATAAVIGAVSLSANAINTAAGKGSIVTPTRGWQSVSNPSAAAPGSPVERDAALRIRQSYSTAPASQTIIEGIRGAVAAVAGVTQAVVYENTKDAPDGNGLPGHTISAVVLGGSSADIAAAINLRKTGGGGTFGTTIVPITDQFGFTQKISFFRPNVVPISYSLGIRPMAGFTAAIQAQIPTALAAWTNALGIGKSLLINRVFVPASLMGAAAQTFEITYLYASRNGLPPTNTDVPIAFNEMASTVEANVSIALVP